MSKTKKLEELVEINKRLQSEIDDLLETNKKLQSENQEVVKNRNMLLWYTGGVESATDGIITIVDDVITHVNPNLCEILGYSREELIGSHYLINVHPDEKPKVKERFQKHKWEEEVSQKFESALIDKKRNRVDVVIQVSYIPFDNSIAYLCVIRNITDRKKAEMTLRENEIKFKELIENINDWVWELDEKGNYIYSSPQVLKIIGYSPEEIIGKKSLSFIVEEDVIKLYKTLENTADPITSVFRFESRNVHKDGHIVYIEANNVPIYDFRGNLCGWRGSNRDITERKKAENELLKKTKELERSNDELQKFAYVASHDLKAPLKTISGYIHLLKKNNKDLFKKKSMKYIRSAINGLNRMERFIDDLLKYSQVGNNPTQDFKLIDFNKILDVTLSVLKASIKENEADIKILIHHKFPRILGDFTQIVQLFQNLILNSMKFVKDKLPEIRIGSEEKNGFHQFFVRDNGIGIDPKNSDKIFAIFQRLHNSDEYSGNGIGLAVCKKIVERHGGEIWVESEIGKGSTFWFSIPKVIKK